VYRREAWRLALADQGVDDVALADELAERFGVERRARHQVFDDVEPALIALSRTHVLGLVTNGASCLQREKLAATDLGRHFATVVISGDLGIGKPDPAIFRHALEQLGCTRATMIGDDLGNDVEGALATGLDAVWINRFGRPSRPDLVEVDSLTRIARERA
jgi:putative hydrolase of the HAD superfamily